MQVEQKKEMPKPQVEQSAPVVSKVTQEKYNKAAERQAKLAKENEEEKKELAKEEIKKVVTEAEVFAGEKFEELPVNDKLK